MKQWFLSVSLVVLLLSAVKANAQQVRAVPTNAGMISVSASGEEKVLPDLLQLDVIVTAGAELGSDAAAKYRDTVKRAKESLENQSIGGLKVEDLGMTVSHQQGTGATPAYYVPIGGPVFAPVPPASSAQPNMPDNTSISKTLRLTVGGIDKLSEDDVAQLVAKLLDAAKDVGGTTNGASIRFVVSDPSAARKSAAKNAFVAAKENAEHLASIAEVKLGRVAHLDERDNLNSLQSIVSTSVALYDGSIAYPTSVPSHAGSSQVSSPTFKPIQVGVTVQAQFHLQPDEKQQ